MKRFLVMSIVCFVFLGRIEGQIPKEPGNIPSPQSWNFVQYGKSPISYYTGLPNISVNLDQVEQSGLKLPISLNYNIASVKPDIHPGPTGLGWNLNLGGVITRNVRGLTDEFYFEQDVNPGMPGHVTYTYFNGYRNMSNPMLNDVSSSSILGLTRPIICTGPESINCLDPVTPNSYHKLSQIPQTLPFLWDNVTYYPPSNVRALFWPADNVNCVSSLSQWINKGLIDREPDEFSFNVMGLSGKFYLNRGNTTEVTNIVCDKKIKVYVSAISENANVPSELEVPIYRGPSNTSDDFFYGKSPWQYNHRYPKTIVSFTIVDEEGNHYTFGRNSPSDYLDAIEYSIDVYNISQDYWKADSWYLRSVSLSNGKTINYHYDRGNFQTNMYLSSYDANISTTDLAKFRWDDRGGKLIFPTYLSRINSEDFEIKLNYSESVQLKYEDAIPSIYSFKPGLPPDYIYNKIDEYVFASNPLSWLKLDQIRVTRNDAPPVYYNLNYNNVSNQRLLLQSIVTNDGTNNISNYQFTYNTSMSLPNYLSGQTDHWGYWNGRSPTHSPTIFYQTKEPNTPFLYPGILNKIKYPTGGFTELNYEPNEYGRIVEPNRTIQPTVVNNSLGGGLRIQKIEDYDAITPMPFNKREFIYKSGYSNSLTPSQIQQLPSSGVLNARPKYYWSGNVPYYNLCNNPPGSTIFAVASSQPLYYLTDEYQLGYSEVIEKSVNGSYSINKFSNHDNGYLDEMYMTSYNDVFASPYTRYTSKSLERGKQLEKIDFNNAGQLVYKKTTSYKPGDASKPAFSDCNASYFNNESYGPSGGSGGGRIFVDKMVLFGTQYLKYKYQFLPDVEDEYIYQNGINPIKNTTQYFYENSKVGQPTKIVSTNSKGEELTTILKYAHDYPGNFMMANIAGNKPNTILEKLQLKKEPITGIQKVTSGELSEFGLSIGTKMPWLNSVYKMEINQPFNYNSYFPTIPNTRDFNSAVLYSKDTRYGTVGNVLKYDDSYNPLEVITKRGDRTIVIRGGRNNLTIGSVISPVGEVASFLWGCTSFEDYKYRDNEGYLFTEFDGAKDFIYSGSTNSDAFSGKQSFNGTLTSKDFVHSADIYVLAKRGGNIPIFQYISGTTTYNGTPFIKIGERSNWDVYMTSHSNGGTKIKINSNGNLIDEVRVLALNSKSYMTTYCSQNGQIVTTTDKNFNRTFYEYDKLDRLVLIRDKDNNVLKKICYNYAGQVEDCTTACTNLDPIWQNTNDFDCEQGTCGNTGNQRQKQININPCNSSTFRWIVIGYNTTACPLQTCLNLTSTNTYNTQGYVASYYNIATAVTYTFNVSTTSGLQPLGTVPPGNYNLTISRPVLGNIYSIFKSGCGKQTITDYSAIFYNIPVSTASCNSITTSLNVEY